jgi:hypothetical protein
LLINLFIWKGLLWNQEIPARQIEAVLTRIAVTISSRHPERGSLKEIAVKPHGFLLSMAAIHLGRNNNYLLVC